MGPTAPPNRLERPGSSLYLIDSIGVSSRSSYRLSRPIQPPYVLRICLSPPALNSTRFRSHFGIRAYSSVFHQLYNHIKTLTFTRNFHEAAGYKQLVEK